MAQTIQQRYKHLSMPARYLINTILVVVFLLVGQLLIAGGSINRYQGTVIEQVGVFIIMAVSLNIATGYLGQLPLGHAGFMSVGGYASAIFIMHMMPVFGLDSRTIAAANPMAWLLFALGLLVGGVVAALFGLIIGIPALRLKGDYLAIVTLGFAEIIRVIILNIDGVVGFQLTGGAKGLTGIPDYTSFLRVFIAVALVIFCIHTFMKSRHGRAVLAIRDNEIAAEASGVNTTRYKIMAFVLSAFFAGIGGALYAGSIGVLAPAHFGFMRSVEILVMVVLGGMGSMLGSVISATVLTVLPEVLRAFSDYRVVAYSIVLILVMIFRPQGLLGSYDFSLSRILERLINGHVPWSKKDESIQAAKAVQVATAVQLDERIDEPAQSANPTKAAQTTSPEVQSTDTDQANQSTQAPQAEEVDHA